MPDSTVVNVCFHGIGTPQRELEPGEDPYWVTTDEFLRVLDEIATWPSAAISFDDGNASDARIALPALTDRGLAATFFALAGRLDSPGSLSREDLRELVRHGMAVGTHGMAHRPWRRMDAQTRDVELVRARRELSEACGVEVTEAACPLGRYDRELLNHLRRLGYRRVYTSDRSPARAGAWLQPRFSVRTGDTPESVRRDFLTTPGTARDLRNRLVGLAKRIR
jgi:peptidoglycan/xylan/chitin deacetylase (PgdA/CDA1 family)